jgi:hypothetical protein
VNLALHRNLAGYRFGAGRAVTIRVDIAAAGTPEDPWSRGTQNGETAMRTRLCAVILAAVAVLAAGCGTQQASTVTLSAAVANRGSYPDRRGGA